MTVILLNAMALSVVWIGIDDKILKTVEQIQEIFNYIFIVECALKLTAYQKFYFYSGWNLFDAIIVFGGIVGILFKSSLAS